MNQEARFTESDVRELLKDYLQANEDHFGGLEHVTSDDFMEYVANVRPHERTEEWNSVEEGYLSNDENPGWMIKVIDRLIEATERAEVHSTDDERIVDLHWAWVNLMLTIPGALMGFLAYIPGHWTYDANKWIDNPTTHDYVAAFIFDMIEARAKERK